MAPGNMQPAAAAREFRPTGWATNLLYCRSAGRPIRSPPDEVRPMSTNMISIRVGTRILRSCGALLLAGAVVLLTGANCTPAGVENTPTGGKTQSGGGGNHGGGGGGGSEGGTGGSTCPPAGCVNPVDAGPINVKNCGDGKLDPGEGCDDGHRPSEKIGANAIQDTGCNALCQIEADYVCPTPGQPCVSQRVCGNKILTVDENCDDGNIVSGDGCSANCQDIEPGYECRVPGKPCTPI